MYSLQGAYPREDKMKRKKERNKKKRKSAWSQAQPARVGK
jgi:hypothetical protein